MRLTAFIMLMLAAPFLVGAVKADEMPLQVEDFSKSTVVVDGAKHLGATAESMAEVIDNVFHRYGAPDAIIRGEEASGGFIISLRYGRGTLQFQSGEEYPIFWRGPSAGIGLPGGAGTKSFTLIYGAKTPEDVYKRFFGIDGSAIVGGGVALNYLQRDNIVIVPIRAGVGFKLEAAVGYLHFTPKKGWFPL